MQSGFDGFRESWDAEWRYPKMSDRRFHRRANGKSIQYGS